MKLRGKLNRIQLILCLALALTFGICIESFELFSKDLWPEASIRSSKDTAQDVWLGNKSFRKMVRRHNSFLPELKNWRKLIAKHAPGLASLLKTISGSDLFAEDELSVVLQNPRGYGKIPENPDVFAPWTNQWSGVWSNGAPQFHTWDSTRFVENQWIQPVGISEKRFVCACCAEEMRRQRQADIAINVFSPENGVTGWVSKSQYRFVEMPHVGYVLNDTTLVWFLQIKEDDLFEKSDRWFVYLESIHLSAEPVVYQISGLEFKMTKTMLVPLDKPNQHCATYYAKSKKSGIAANYNKHHRS